MSVKQRGPDHHADDCCHIDIRIESKGDVNIYNCTKPAPDREPTAPPAHEECPPPRAEGACVPLGLGCKPKQSRRRKLEKLLARNKVPSAIGAVFFQSARRFVRGRSAANDFERDIFRLFESMPPPLRGILECAVDSFQNVPPDLRNAGLEPSITADAEKPIDGATLSTALVSEIKQRAADAMFGNPHALDAERPGRNRFFDPGSEEIFFSQLQICRVDDLRTASFRPPLTLGDYLPAEIQQHCELVLGDDQQITQNCSVQTTNCPGNVLPDNVCARVADVENGDGVVLTGVNFMNVDMKVRLRQRAGTAQVELDTHVFGDLETQLNEEVNGVVSIIQDCRVKDRASFVVPDDLPPGIYELQLALPNTTGIPSLGPVILSNIEFINIVPPSTARFQIVAERLRAREETSPASFGSDEVALTVLAAPLLPDGNTGPIQRLDRRFDDVDSGENRQINTVIFTHAEEIAGVAMSVIGFEVDSERAFREQLRNFSDAFVDFVELVWNKFRDEIVSGAGALIKALGLVKGAIVVAIAALLAIAIIAVVAYWAPADLIIDDVIGFSVVDLAELTNANVPMPGISHFESPQGLDINLTPLEKTALTYREFREYVSDEEDSNYEIFFRYNRTA